LRYDQKVLEVNLLEISNQVLSVKAENVDLAHKVNTLNLQLSLESGNKAKLSNLNVELNKLKNINGVLKKCASKLEVQYKDTAAELAKCILEKNNLAEEMNELENTLTDDYNALSHRYGLLKQAIRSNTDPPPFFS